MEIPLILINCRLNAVDRKKRLINLVGELLPMVPLHFSVRVRGTFAHQGLKELENLMMDFPESKRHIIEGSNFGNWKLDTLQQLQKTKSEYILLLQEDHFPICSNEVLKKFLSSISEVRCDFASLSFHRQNLELAQDIKNVMGDTTHNDDFYSANINGESFRKIREKNSTYLVNLVGIFRRDFLRKILVSEKPFIKRFPQNSPFLFEQRTEQKWFLPIKSGYSKNEIFACLNDDHGFLNSSLYSRGWENSDPPRKIEYHSENKIFQKIESIIKGSPITNKNKNRVRYFFSWIRILGYSFFGLLTRPQRALQRYFISKVTSY